MSKTGTQTKCPLPIAPRNGLAFGQNANTDHRTRRKGGLGKPRSKSPTGWVSCPRPAHSRARDRRVIAVDRPAATSTSSGQRTGERSGRRTTAHSSRDARSGGFRSAADRVTPDEIRHHVRRGTLPLLHERASTATGSVPRTAVSRRRVSRLAPEAPPRALPNRHPRGEGFIFRLSLNRSVLVADPTPLPHNLTRFVASVASAG